ncbi:hypothetical protein WIS52_12245 [Pseudonocardia nematodicida]|uniref:Glycine zipper domain-containing protein n=1 Tax=Pseudonocardia nematodicida TaxID=1206997 RepID=A0ABV1K9U6_9PSEU
MGDPLSGGQGMWFWVVLGGVAGGVVGLLLGQWWVVVAGIALGVAGYYLGQQFAPKHPDGPAGAEPDAESGSPGPSVRD